MPRVGGDGSGSAEATEEKSAFGGWFENATRAMKGGNTGGGYVVLGATRYGLRLSQVSAQILSYVPVYVIEKSKIPRLAHS